MAALAGLEEFVEIDENERAWVGKGFGKGGLLPNDRGSYTTVDGTLSWKTSQDAEKDQLLLGRGWKYLPDSEFEVTHPDDKEKCWMYASDFRTESILQAKPDRGVMHWVRYRRLVRIKTFHPKEFVPEEIYSKCDHCDSSAIESLSKLLLDVLAYCTLLHNSTHLTNAVALPLKKSIIDLAVGFELTDSDAPAKDVDGFYKLGKLRTALEQFVDAERTHTMISRIFSGIDYFFHARQGHKEFTDRCDRVSARCLSKSERDAIAGLIVRKLDTKFQLHCKKVGCGDDCQFIRIVCPHEGCTKTMSKLYLDSHIPGCPHKLITCECGESVKQRDLIHHQSTSCKLRYVECPFIKIGCTELVKECELEEHLATKSTAHLLLAMKKIFELEDHLNDSRGKIAGLVRQNTELKQSLQQQHQTSQREIAKLSSQLQKTNKVLSTLETTCKKEFKKTKTDK